MTSRDLTAEQLDRLIATVDRQFAYYAKAWRRVQANGIAIDDPLATGVCEVGEALRKWRDVLVRLKSRLPKPHRPLAKTEKTRGLASVELPVAQKQRDAAEAIARYAQRPIPPYDTSKALPPRHEVTTSWSPSSEELARMEKNRLTDLAKYGPRPRRERRKR